MIPGITSWRRGGAYTGPLDLVPGAKFAYSANRALGTPMLGQDIFSVTVGVTTQAFAADVVTGNVDNAAVSTFVGAGPGFVTKWEAQAGGSFDLVAAFDEDRPLWADSEQDGKAGFISNPAMIDPTDGELSVLNVTLPVFTAGGFTIFVLSKGKTVAFPVVEIGWDNGSQAIIENGATAKAPYCYATTDPSFNEAGGEATETADNTTYFLWEHAWEFGSWNILKNGLALTLGSSFDSGALDDTTGDGSFVIRFTLDGSAIGVIEVLVWDGVLSSGDRTLIRQNIATYYGITLP